MNDEPEIFDMLTELQASMANRLESLDLFTGREGLSVVTEDLGNVLAELDKRVSRIGLGFAIVTPKVTKGERPREIFVSAVVEVVEQPTINRGSGGSRVRAMDAAVAVIGLFDNWFVDPWTPFILESANQVAPPPAADGATSFQNAVAWDVTFQTGTILHVQTLEPVT